MEKDDESENEFLESTLVTEEKNIKTNTALNES